MSDLSLHVKKDFGAGASSGPRRPLIVTLLVLGAVGITGAACTTGRDTAAAMPPGLAAEVDATTLLSFSPNVVRVKVGDTVEWKNASPFHHTVTDDPARASDRADAALPRGAAAFSGDLPSGGTFRHRFTRAGTYRYFCMPHEDMGMKGTVVVTAR